ncbi:MAG: hypothetical protein K2Z81_04250, partial [Cyanobacteria bacterium]|nr:hypothetical protein [Cyanobacteriota bacterium]
LICGILAAFRQKLHLADCPDSSGHLSHHGINGNIVSVPELIARTKPAKCYFSPHDLQQPLKADELVALRYFDALFMPNDRHWYLGRYTRVINSGWLKWGRNLAGLSESLHSVLVVSEAPTLIRLGKEQVFQLYEPILRDGPTIILPRFGATGALADIFSSFDCKLEVVRDCTEWLVRAEVVFTNGLSSVALEAAALKKPTVCVTDGTQPRELQDETFGHIPQIFVGEPSAAMRWLTKVRQQPIQFADLEIRPADWDVVFTELES